MLSSVFWLLSLISIFALFISKDLLINILLFGLFGAFSSGAFMFMGAPDVSFASFALGAAFTTFVFLISIRKTGKLTVGYVNAPYMFEETAEGKAHGFEYEILRDFAKNANLEFEFVLIDSVDDLKYHSSQFDVLAGGLFENILPPDFTQHYYSVGVIPTRIAYDKNGTLRDLMRIKSLIVSGIQTLDFLSESVASEYVLLVNKHNADLHSKIQDYLKKIKDNGNLEEYVSRNLG